MYWGLILASNIYITVSVTLITNTMTVRVTSNLERPRVPSLSSFVPDERYEWRENDRSDARLI